MLEIDFLPAHYRRRQARQRSKPWHAVLVSAFAVLVGIAAVGQYREQARLRADLSLVAPQYEQAVAMGVRLGELHEELEHARAKAALINYLRHPWPRTQLLRALLEPLPDSVVFTELEIADELPAVRRLPDRQRPRSDGGEQSLAEIPPAERDLAALRQQADAMQTVVRVAGTAADGAALHRYLGMLARSSLFHRAELESIESAESRDGRFAQFRAKVVVRPGYGQPGGPAGPEHEAIARHGGP